MIVVNTCEGKKGGRQKRLQSRQTDYNSGLTSAKEREGGRWGREVFHDSAVKGSFSKAHGESLNQSYLSKEVDLQKPVLRFLLCSVIVWEQPIGYVASVQSCGRFKALRLGPLVN